MTITANPASRVYGAADPTFTYTISGFIQGTDPGDQRCDRGPVVHDDSHFDQPRGEPTDRHRHRHAQVGGLPVLLRSWHADDQPAPLKIKANDTSQPLGTTPSLSASYIGLVNGDTAASLTAPAVLSTTATSASLPGTYPITVSGARSTDYSITFAGGTFTVLKSTTSSSLEGPILRAATTSPVTFIVDVSPSSEGSVPMTGNVMFYDGTHLFGVAPVVNGTATLTTSALARGQPHGLRRVPGGHELPAVDDGDHHSDGLQHGTGSEDQPCGSGSPASQEDPVPKPKPAEAQGTPGDQAQSKSGDQAEMAVAVKTPVKKAVVLKKQ